MNNERELLKSELISFIGFVKKIYKNTNLDETVIDNLINEGIDKVCQKKINLKDIKEKVEECIINEINEYIKGIILSDKENMYIVNDWINNIFQNSNHYEHDFSLFSDLFDLIELNPSPDLILLIMKQSLKFVSIIEIIVNDKLSSIKRMPLNQIFKDQLLIMCVEIYCELKNIRICENDNIDELLKNENITNSLSIYIKEINRYPLLKSNESRNLFKQYKLGDLKARNRLIESNLRLVVSISYRYLMHNYDILDIIQEGNIGLMKAVEKYNYKKGYTFSTYASYWIRSYIMQGIKQKSRNIKIPIYMYDKLIKYNKLIENNTFSQDEIKSVLTIGDKELNQLETFKEDTLSLNQQMFEDNNIYELIDYIADKNYNLMDEVTSYFLNHDLHQLFKMANLSEREQSIIKNRYGLNKFNKIYTQKELGQMYNISCQAIGAYEKRALQKLKQLPKIKEYSIYMDNPTQAIKKIKSIDVVRFKSSIIKKEESISSIPKIFNKYCIELDEDYLNIINTVWKLSLSSRIILNEDEKLIISMQMNNKNNNYISVAKISSIFNLPESYIMSLMRNIVSKYENYYSNGISSKKKIKIINLIDKMDNNLYFN